MSLTIKIADQRWVSKYPKILENQNGYAISVSFCLSTIKAIFLRSIGSKGIK